VRIAVTGTPGTGKTTATDLVDSSLSVIHLNEVIKQEELNVDYDHGRDTVVTDLDAVSDWLAGKEDIIVESHLSHQFAVDKVVVLRCHPETLQSRLADRGESAASIEENAESEALDIILSEAVSRHGEDNVYEIDTTERTPEDIAENIEGVIAGEEPPRVGTVSFIDYLTDRTDNSL